MDSNHNNNKRRRPQQKQTSMSKTMTTSAMMFLLLSIGGISQTTDAFATSSTLTMSYKPPVKSSVSKLGNNRSTPGSNKRSRQYASAASAAYAPTTQPPSSRTASFRDRMRGMLGNDTTASQNNPSEQRKRILPSNVYEVATLDSYKEVVGKESERVVAVRFFAPWCKACKAVEPYFYRIANQFPNVVFVDVPVTEKNTNLHQGLGVPSLPYGHIYHPNGGLVESTRMTKKYISGFARKIQSYVQGSCELQQVGNTSDPYL